MVGGVSVNLGWSSGEVSDRRRVECGCQCWVECGYLGWVEGGVEMTEERVEWMGM